MRNFYHTCNFSILTINFSEVWSRQILDLGKQFNLMICLENVLKTSLPDVLKMSWRRLEDIFKTSWRRLEDILKTFLQDVFQTSSRNLQDVLPRRLEDVLKTPWRRMARANILVLIKRSWRRLEDVFWRLMSKTNIFVLIKTSWRRHLKMKDVFKTC